MGFEPLEMKAIIIGGGIGGLSTALAIEDAVCLAATLADGPDVEAALRRYERTRLPRATAITNDSWRIGSVGQWANPVGCWLRNLSTRWTPGWVWSRLLAGWLNHDLPQLERAPRA
jgi:2-polyprenyl-6-methoxyphenol hydroxylase-like FAD-dependent oxidoreductase